MKLLFAAVFPIFFLSAIKQADSSAYDKIVTHSRIRAKKEGPNVCALQQVMGTNKKYFSTCRNWYQGSICGKKATVLYECCPGYMKLDGMPGCPAVAPIDNVYGTLGIVNALLTQDYTDQSKLREEIEGRGSFTFFAPSDEAWSLLDPEVRSALVSNVNIELYNALHYHMVNKRLLTKDLKNGMTLESMYNKLGLLINHYSNGIVTVNCARIIHGNQIATNGVVHKIDRVVTAVSNTIQDYIEIEDDVSSFKAAAIASDTIDKFGEPGHYTLFLPTNEAFAKLPRSVLERIMSDKVALQAVLNFHTLNSVQCSEAIMAGSSYETLEGNNIEIGCDGDSMTVNGVKMVKRKDIVTTNGVIHLIDEVLIPDSAKQVLELTGPSQTTFTDLVAQLGLSGSIRPQGEYTLLAPLNAAFSDDVLSMDQRVLKLVLQNHILKNKIILSGLYNGQHLETLGGKTLRVFIYRTSVCIENSCMIRGSKEGRNGALHLLRNIIKPAEKPMIDILRGDDRFSIFLSLVEAAGLTEMLKQEGDWTLFAPTNDAFENLSEEEMELLTSDINTLRTILLYHFSNGVFIGGGMELGVTNLLKTIQGNNLMVKAINNTILANEVKAEESDLMANNGVIHVVKSLLYPADMPVGNNELLAILKKLIKNIHLKFIQGYKYKEIPLTFIKRIHTTKIVEPEIKVTGGHTITKVISGEPQKPKARKPKVKVVGGETVKKVVQDPSVTTTIRRVIEEPSLTKLTRVIEGEPSVTKITRVIEGEPSLTKLTRVIQGESDINFGQGETITKVVHDQRLGTAGEIENEEDIKKLLEQEVTKVKKLLESDGHLLEDEEIKRLLQGDNIKRPPPRRIPAPKRRTRKVRQEKN